MIFGQVATLNNLGLRHTVLDPSYHVHKTLSCVLIAISGSTNTGLLKESDEWQDIIQKRVPIYYLMTAGADPGGVDRVASHPLCTSLALMYVMFVL